MAECGIIIKHIGLYAFEKWKQPSFPIKACLHNAEELQLQALIWMFLISRQGTVMREQTTWMND